MFVCICNAIRERDLRGAARCHGGDAESLYARLGHRPQCRQCLDEAQDIVDDERRCATARAPAAFAPAPLRQAAALA